MLPDSCISNWCDESRKINELQDNKPCLVKLTKEEFKNKFIKDITDKNEKEGLAL